MKNILYFLITVFAFVSNTSSAQDVVPIQNYSVNNFGQVQLEIDAQADKYYLLSTLHSPYLDYESITSMTLGVDGPLIISEPLSAYPQSNYTIREYSIDSPGDIDLDGIDDVTEINDMPDLAPLNYAEQIPIINGAPVITSKEMFADLSVIKEDISWAPFLNNQEYAKFAIVDIDSATPAIYFINSVTHNIHASFLGTIGLSLDNVVTGEIVYNPNDIFYNGAIGSYSFNFSFGATYEFSRVQKTFELLATNMPFLENNLQHFVGGQGESFYGNIQDEYIGSRIPVVLESVFFEDVDYIPLNESEGFGFFRHMGLDDNPGSRDIVLYDVLPNTLPRVGGIMTSVIQTPLSHVNLRAIQDNLPNAYIKNPLEIDAIADLVDKYVYYKVENESYTLREATIEEVNAWYEDIRPTEAQIPERDLSITEIMPLDDITFEMSTSFGAKCANVATMRTFGFPEGTIPDGFGIPFYYYDEFMKFNDFYAEAQEMIEDADFIADLDIRLEMLKQFRRDIKDADMPQWMLDDLQEMHDAFPEGTAVRVRSSTNNEDLPGFSGAGLYTSKTQHLDEGHISKSVKQVYASMWNFRAFDEREFYRVDNFIAAMGLLCHPNFQEEKSNGVGVSIDPIYMTNNTYYLNTQVGESLITNPDANSIPEELLLNIDPEEGYFVIRNSNLIPNGQLVMGEEYLNQMRDYLTVIHEEFEVLYNVVGAEGFGMDIEYKVTVDDQLIIKQARPWVSFWADINAAEDLGVIELIDPNMNGNFGDSELINVLVGNEGLREMSNYEVSLHIDDQFIETLTIVEVHTPQTDKEYEFTMPQDFSIEGEYDIMVTVNHPTDGFSTNDTLLTTINSLFALEAGVSIGFGAPGCGAEIETLVSITNNGYETINDIEFELIVNGVVAETITYSTNVPFSVVADVPVVITENLQPIGNVIEVNLISINGVEDSIDTNNSASFSADLDNDNEQVILEINADNFPGETTWSLTLQGSNSIIASGDLGDASQGETVLSQLCVNPEDCYTLTLMDTYGDGICCGYGQGSFSVYLQDGQQLVIGDGDFGSQVQHDFCPGNPDCLMTANAITTNASTQSTNDGVIVIDVEGGLAPYTFSIDDGTSFADDNVFSDLLAGEYPIQIIDATGECTFETIVVIDFNVSNENHILNNKIEVSPNPTQDDFEIRVESSINFSNAIEIEVYNNLGRLVKSSEIKVSTYSTTISLDEAPSGTYFVKCYTQDFEQYFKMVKM